MEPAIFNTPVLTLTGHEGGVWIVTTRDSSYYFDLRLMTVTRRPGPNATRSVHDKRRPIRTIDSCQVGEKGRWTMEAEEWSMLEYYWQVTTPVIGIDRQTDQADPGASGHAVP